MVPSKSQRRSPAPPPDKASPTPRPLTLYEALRETAEHRWRGMRSYRRNISQASQAIMTVERIVTGSKRDATRVRCRTITVEGFDFKIYTGTKPPSTAKAKPIGEGHHVILTAVTPDVLRTAVRQWQAEGVSASTIRARLNCLSALGVCVNGTRPRLPRKMKWWLSEDAERDLVAQLRATGQPRKVLLADFIVFQCRCGLRVEEALRLRFTDIFIRDGRTFITVPGSKTASAQKSLPVGEEAAALLARRGAEWLERRNASGTTLPLAVFDMAYWELQRSWKEARLMLGLEDPAIATLKALRRSAARSLTTKGMSAFMLKDYLRHSTLGTTMGYLHLVGGFEGDELAKWV